MIIIEKATASPELALIGSLSVWHWLIVLAVVLLLFGGGGKIPRLMKDLGTGVKSFKRGLKEEDKGEAKDDDTKAIEAETVTPASSSSKDKTAASS
jgi:sec-independent protein translocase protein TatA